MQTLFLEKNPFYILEVSPEDKRTIIIEKAEEKAFFTDNSLYENSQANLLNPAKRLTAEFDWFYDISNDKMSAIYENINSHTEIITDGMTGISKLNATLHNFSIAEYDDYFEIGYAILDIDEQYNNINLNTLTNIINSCREKAGINSITEADANDALNKKRKEISQLLDEKMQFLSNDDYIDLITMIAEKCIDDNYKDGIIISDVIDEYEIKKQADLSACFCYSKMSQGNSFGKLCENSIGSPVLILLNFIFFEKSAIFPLSFPPYFLSAKSGIFLDANCTLI